MERRFILHMLTPGRQMSPFDVNMAVDAGYEVVVPYCDVATDQVRGLVQDAIFSRGPKGVARTGVFIGGRDVVQAVDMLDAARAAMVPPFEVSVFADPSGSFTTAAAMVAATERQLRKAHGTDFTGKRVFVAGGTGPVGRIVALLCEQLGASVFIGSHRGADHAAESADSTNARFGGKLAGADASTAEARREQLAQSEVVLACAAAGVQVISAEDIAVAGQKLLVAADVNAVPPEGVAGVGVFDDGKLLPGTRAVGIGALAIGNIKYKTQNGLFVRMREAGKPQYLSFPEALALARELVAESA
ncbi:NAD(P)-dependent methylenetetrahydromethanopterin dehydrogenase [Derxia gummosa]|uniref:NAD(P)-dependent methylenetetrahydromethanopterin dehydrogenase n=1 Tax=Derxia gummosa DSM 723 TaxID=1121388 RepID=A0A9U5CSQ6_9BURK|nr:NAD(P)-dependent methylenetetrahydromethanopterin dehydrogenase [Derxia gummosa]